MNGEDAFAVGGARRVFAELTDPAAGLVADFVTAEDRAAAFDPDLPLLDADLFGGITLPGSAAARGRNQTSTRRAPTPPERPAAPAVSPPPPAHAVTPPPAGGAVGAGPHALTSRPVEASSPARAASGAPPVFRLAARSTQSTSAPTVGSVAGAPTAEATAAVQTQGGGSPGSQATSAATAGTPLRGSAPADAVEGAVALIAELTASILAAGGGALAAGGAGTAGAATSTNGVTGARPRTAGESPEQADQGSAFLEETVRSLGSETAAALGFELEAPELRPAAEPGRGRAGAGSARAGNTPASGQRASPELLGVVQAPVGAGLAAAARVGEVDSDPTALAALVNEVLVEQARRHGLELG